MAVQSFHKKERLRKKVAIEELFNTGSYFYLSPFKVIYTRVKQENANRSSLLISVPKRLFKRAVDRNRIKRQIREAYRLNKNLLEPSRPWHIGFIFINKAELPSPTVEEAMKHSLLKLNHVTL